MTIQVTAYCCLKNMHRYFLFIISMLRCVISVFYLQSGESRLIRLYISLAVDNLLNLLKTKGFSDLFTPQDSSLNGCREISG